MVPILVNLSWLLAVEVVVSRLRLRKVHLKKAAASEEVDYCRCCLQSIAQN